MKKLTITIFVIALMITSCKRNNKNINNTSAGEIISVKVASVQSTETNNDIIATGLLTTENEAKLSFKIGGVIDQIFVDEGEFIHKGQLLAVLKTTEIGSQLEQAKLGYAKAKRDYDRINNLYKDSVATLEQLQNTKTILDIAQKTVDLVSFNNEFASIISPANGFITKKISNQGEVVSSGNSVLIINETDIQSNWLLKVGVSDKEWAIISVGQKAMVEIDAFGPKIFEATVYKKSQAADVTNGTFQVELKIIFREEMPAVGMFGKARILTGTKHGISIPYDALVEADGNNAFVFVAADNNKIKRIPIVIESFDNKQVVVKSGLEKVKNIIVSNSAFLNEKSSISIIK